MSILADAGLNLSWSRLFNLSDNWRADGQTVIPCVNGRAIPESGNKRILEQSWRERLQVVFTASHPRSLVETPGRQGSPTCVWPLVRLSSEPVSSWHRTMTYLAFSSQIILILFGCYEEPIRLFLFIQPICLPDHAVHLPACSWVQPEKNLISNRSVTACTSLRPAHLTLTSHAVRFRPAQAIWQNIFQIVYLPASLCTSLTFC